MEKIKHFLVSQKGKDILTIIIVILVGFASFELGRLSNENSSGGLKIDYPGQSNGTVEPLKTTQTSPNTANVASASTGKNFFASSKGTKYYTISCTAGKTIKPENRVYFTTGEEAVAAGYTLSGSCI